MFDSLYVLHLQIYNEKKSQFEIKRNNPKDLVERVARDISKLLHSKRKALEVRCDAAHITTTPVYKRAVPQMHTYMADQVKLLLIQIHALCFIARYVKHRQTGKTPVVL